MKKIMIFLNLVCLFFIVNSVSLHDKLVDLEKSLHILAENLSEKRKEPDIKEKQYSDLRLLAPHYLLGDYLKKGGSGKFGMKTYADLGIQANKLPAANNLEQAVLNSYFGLAPNANAYEIRVWDQSECKLGGATCVLQSLKNNLFGLNLISKPQSFIQQGVIDLLKNRDSLFETWQKEGNLEGVNWIDPRIPNYIFLKEFKKGNKIGNIPNDFQEIAYSILFDVPQKQKNESLENELQEIIKKNNPGENAINLASLATLLSSYIPDEKLPSGMHPDDTYDFWKSHLLLNNASLGAYGMIVYLNQNHNIGINVLKKDNTYEFIVMDSLFSMDSYKDIIKNYIGMHLYLDKLLLPTIVGILKRTENHNIFTNYEAKELVNIKGIFAIIGTERIQKHPDFAKYKPYFCNLLEKTYRFLNGLNKKEIGSSVTYTPKGAKFGQVLYEVPSLEKQEQFKEEIRNIARTYFDCDL